MKANKKMVSLVLTVVLLASIFVACAASTTEIHNPQAAQPTGYDSGFVDSAIREVPLSDGEFIDISAEMVPMTESAPTSVLMPSAPGTNEKKNDKALIDYSNAKDGYVMVKYLKDTTKALRVQVKGQSGTAYTYILKSNGDFEVFPLSDGNGEYSVGVYEQVEGNKYSTSNSLTLNVDLTDEFAPFLRPNQYVNYKADSETVKKAAELIKDAKDINETISAVYEFIVNNFKYDKELAATVQSGYLPDLDAVLAKKKGICFDYAAVMTGMLRSQGVPTKLVVGYTGTTYHAWINVYSKESGWINSAIFFDGKSWKLMDPTFASTGKESSEVMKYIGDGKNYSAKYLY